MISKILAKFGYFKQNPQVRDTNQYIGDFVINFDSLDIFSIERDYHKGEIVTIIGYHTDDGRQGEWFLSLTLTQHEHLCIDFKKYLANKNERKQ